MVDRKIATWSMRKIIISYVLFVLAFFVIVILIWDYLGTKRLHEDVQQALDRACGVSVVLQSDGSYNYDPRTSWGSREATCDKNFDNEWECHCFDTSP